MPVNSTHPDYKANLDKWNKCRVCYEGEEAVKAAGSVYLPMLRDQDSAAYEAYKMRASFFNATRRTVQGLAGLAFRKPPEIDFPNEDFLSTIGLNAESLLTMVRNTLEECLCPGRTALYVDATDEGDPYVVQYYPENIINWDTTIIDGREELILVVIKEMALLPTPDKYEKRKVERYRVLQLDMSTGTPVYFVQIWQRNDSYNISKPVGERGEEFVQVGDDITPKAKGGLSFDRIPFKFVNTSDLSADIEQPPLLDMVNINLSHYRTSADLEHGRHFTALPTAWVAGFDPKTNGQLYIGSTKAWVTSDSAAHAGFLEFTGAGLGHLKDALVHKEAQMAVLGARLLEQQKTAVEAANTLQIRESAQGTTLSGIVSTVSDGITEVLKFVARWLGAPDAKVSFKLNQEFTAINLDAPTITALFAALQSNAISFDVWFYNLQRANLMPEDHTVEKEKAAIEAGGPVTPKMPPMPGATGAPGSVPNPKPAPKPAPVPTAA